MGRSVTRRNLLRSMAHMRYTLWGNKAQADGLRDVARLFRAIAHAEEVHARNHFDAMANEAEAVASPRDPAMLMPERTRPCDSPGGSAPGCRGSRSRVLA